MVDFLLQASGAGRWGTEMGGESLLSVSQTLIAVFGAGDSDLAL